MAARTSARGSCRSGIRISARCRAEIGMRPHHDKTLIAWLLVGWCGFLLLPWYAQEDGFFAFDWLGTAFLSDRDLAPALVQGLWHGRIWLLPLAPILAIPLLALRPGIAQRRQADWLILAGL